ncbi:PepSY-associated TM helix domain-containing protein [Methylomonas albis]|uniref:PepSY domain-containing protein n=1 Tax=Methylomonas albis TaxID=1854563 RepID=A0ABR9CWZ2_9GAMM|nr:PepSY domain-containing protein [Methylomonas albis]MBD9355245.1 PepSY domain-containing protein [Methylomonas albis]
MAIKSQSGDARRSWPDYAAVWRWHFYAGLFCLPFFCWLAITGSVYLFRPDIETWLDSPYEALHIDGPRSAPSSEVRSAVAAVPGSTFSRYEPPATVTGAAQVVVARDGRLFRVYIHPGTLQAMNVEQDDHRLMELVSHLHGQLLLGTGGSMLVELAGSWGVVMILTGLYLWWPRGSSGLGGLLYPRLGLRGRLFWRELHAVTGLWVSMVTLFLLLSGMPWSVNWGNYLTWVRNHWAVTAGAPDWPIGGQDQLTPDIVASAAPSSSMPGMSADEMIAMSPAATHEGQPEERLAADLQALDKLIPVATGLRVPPPIWISPPAEGLRDWTISSHIQNRPLRVTYTVAPDSGVVTGTDDFAAKNIVDKVVNVVIAAHEGQLFGRLNQAILLLNAACLMLVTISAVVMWWRRRPGNMLGAPPPAAQPHRSTPFAVAIAALALLLPLFGLSLLLMLAIDRTLLRRLPAVRCWLGLAPREVREPKVR